MIDSISIHGFRSIAALDDLELRSLNVLIGANGAGKTNLLEALRVLRLAVQDDQKLLEGHVERVGGGDSILHFGSKVTKQAMFKFHLDGSEKPYGYTVWLRPAAKDRLTAHLVADFTQQTADLVMVGAEGPFTVAGNLLEAWRFYHFHDTSFSSPIKQTADLHDNRYLREDASNLAAFLYLLRERHSARYNLIRRTVQLVAPFFHDFALRPTPHNPNKIRLEWRHVGSEGYWDAHSLSDGSMRFIALAALLLQPTSLRPPVILLDEPELGLHPYAITLVAALLKQASVDSQIICATQSPGLLDHFSPEDVLVTDRESGATTIRRLCGEQLGKWLEDYSLGQLWEKNEFGGRPAPEGGS